jgi:hypothetical protein
MNELNETPITVSDEVDNVVLRQFSQLPPAVQRVAIAVLLVTLLVGLAFLREMVKRSAQAQPPAGDETPTL